MYLHFFDLDELPFSLTPDPKFFFMSSKHVDAVRRLEYGINQRQGVIVITGEVGVGKTTVCRALLSGLDEKVKTALVLNPLLSPLELFQAINEDLGLEHADNSPKRLTKILNEFVINQFEQGGNVVLIVDEAHKLSHDSLEQIRLLSNLETSKHKLVQIILFGQPELMRTLSLPAMAPLSQRVSTHYCIGALDEAETSQYVAHRLHVAGCSRGVFSKGALRRIFRYSRGIPRKINLICDKALLCAYGTGETYVNSNYVKLALSELTPPLARMGNSTKKLLKAAWLPAACALLGAFLVVWAMSAGWLDVDRRPARPSVRAAAKNTPAPDRRRAPARQAETAPDVFSVPGFDADGVYRVESEGLSTFGALMTVLRMWGQDVSQLTEPSSGGSAGSSSQLWTMIGSAGFKIETRKLTLADMSVLDLPCLLQLRQETGGTRYCALVSLVGDDAVIADPLVGLIRLQETVLDKRWTRSAIYVVPDLDGLRRTLSVGKRGKDVVAFRARLFNLGLLGDSISDRYDAECVQAVKRFQVLTGLVGDGIAGWRTRLALCREIIANKAPRLSAWDSIDKVDQ